MNTVVSWCSENRTKPQRYKLMLSKHGPQQYINYMYVNIAYTSGVCVCVSLSLYMKVFVYLTEKPEICGTGAL